MSKRKIGSTFSNGQVIHDVIAVDVWKFQVCKTFRNKFNAMAPAKTYENFTNDINTVLCFKLTFKFEKLITLSSP
jgi:hypothetical protein